MKHYQVLPIFIFLSFDFYHLGSAFGVQTPPLLIFQGKRLPNQIKQFLPKGWHAAVSESGWINSEIFFDYISQKFYPWLVENGILTPIILFVDGHVSHRSLELSQFCLDKKIILVSFLPNMTHICQPMDVVAFGPVKNNWVKILKAFRNSHQELNRMPRDLFCQLLGKCVNESLNPELLKTSFVKTGLNPFDANSFDYSKLSTEEESAEDVENVNSHIRSSGIQSDHFLDHLEKSIESKLPGRLEEFKNTVGGQWSGNSHSNDLFLIWKEAGGKTYINVADGIFDSDIVEEPYELLDVVDFVPAVDDLIENRSLL